MFQKIQLILRFQPILMNRLNLPFLKIPKNQIFHLYQTFHLNHLFH
jgi:hypothetical protein